MSRKQKPVKIRVASENLGLLVHDIDKILHVGLGGFSRYFEEGFDLAVRPVWNPDEPTSDLVVFLPRWIVDALTDNRAEQEVMRRYATSAKRAAGADSA